MNLLCGGGKENQTLDINPYLLTKPPCLFLEYQNTLPKSNVVLP